MKDLQADSGLFVFDRARLIHPRLSRIEIHPHVLLHQRAMTGHVTHLSAAVLSETFADKESIRCYLAMNPLVVTRANTNVPRWQLLARVHEYHLAKYKLADSEAVPAVVIPRPSRSQLEQLIVQDNLVNPVLEMSRNPQGKIWAYKSYLEEIGVLALMGLSGLSKRTWAKWLNRDPRTFHEEE